MSRSSHWLICSCCSQQRAQGKGVGFYTEATEVTGNCKLSGYSSKKNGKHTNYNHKSISQQPFSAAFCTLSAFLQIICSLHERNLISSSKIHPEGTICSERQVSWELWRGGTLQASKPGGKSSPHVQVKNHPTHTESREIKVQVQQLKETAPPSYPEVEEAATIVV